MKLSTVMIFCCVSVIALAGYARGSGHKGETVLICKDDLYTKMRSLCTVENMINTYKRMKFLSRNNAIRRIAQKYKRTKRFAADEEEEEKYEGGPPARRLKSRRNRSRRRRRTERRLNRRKRAPSTECCNTPCSVEKVIALYCIHFANRHGS